jgi:hypothetical protein
VGKFLKAPSPYIMGRREYYLHSFFYDAGWR